MIFLQNKDKIPLLVTTKHPAMPLKYLFYTEVIINIPSFIMCWFFPSAFVDQLTKMSADVLTHDFIRWYGVLLFVLTFILGKALYDKDVSALKTVLLGYGIGDLMQIVVTVLLAQHIGGWNFGLIFTVFISVLLVSCRTLVIQKPERLGF